MMKGAARRERCEKAVQRSLETETNGGPDALPACATTVEADDDPRLFVFRDLKVRNMSIITDKINKAIQQFI